MGKTACLDGITICSLYGLTTRIILLSRTDRYEEILFVKSFSIIISVNIINNYYAFLQVIKAAATRNLPVRAPGVIKSVTSFKGELVFVACSPRGVYRMKKDMTFAKLSSTAVNSGPEVNEVLVVGPNGVLNLIDKVAGSKSITELFTLCGEAEDLQFLVLSARDIDESLRTGLRLDDESNVCFIADRGRLYRLSERQSQLIYNNSTVQIREIRRVKRNEKTAALVLLTHTNLCILMHKRSGRSTFDFEEINFDTEVRAICSGFSRHEEDVAWMMQVYMKMKLRSYIVVGHFAIALSGVCFYELFAYIIIFQSDGIKSNHWLKVLNTPEFRKIRVDQQGFCCLELYKSTEILGLTSSNKRLLNISVEAVDIADGSKKATSTSISDECFATNESLVNDIMSKSMELRAVNEILASKEDQLRRINLFANRERISINPRLTVNRVAGSVVLTVDLERNSLPANCDVILTLRSKARNHFVSKRVRGGRVEMSIPSEISLEDFDITMDLMTHCESNNWCLIRDFVKQSSLSCEHLSAEKIQFVSSKLNVLRNLAAEKKLSAIKILELRDSIRKELNDL